MRNNVPCKDCPDRHQWCHSDCEKYKEWISKINEAKVKRDLKDASFTLPNARVKSHNGIEHLRRKRR